MSASSNSVEKRCALDGTRHTYREFEEYYGKDLGRDMWRRCGVTNDDEVNVLDQDVMQKEEGTGAAEHSSEDDDEVWLPSILKVDQVDEVLSSARTSNLSSTTVHNEARSVLVNATKRIHENGVDEVQVLGDWEHWKEYVCMHYYHADIIGEGIVNVVAQAVRGTKDHNREGRPRVDFVFFRRDGSYVRVG